MTEPRRFSKWQRDLIFSNAGGRCQGCGKVLDTDWHADHWMPVHCGGRTVTENGRALCPQCNERKGDKVDQIQLRPFQQELEDTVVARIAAGERTTVALVAPGMGKTVAIFNALNRCYREGLIDYAGPIGVPRLNLQEQMEKDWLEARDLYVVPKLGKFSTRGNVTPLVRADEQGYIPTYQGLGINGGKSHVEWAREHQGQFIAAWDEMQFLGAPDSDSGGLISANVAAEISAYALHTICTTGTQYRSDRRRLIFGDYTEPDENDRVHLISNIPPVTYRQGVAQGFLRPFEALLGEGDGLFDDGAKYDIQKLEERLGAVSLARDTWKQRVDIGLDQLRACQRDHPGYKAVIAAVHMGHAEEISDYIDSCHKDLRGLLAISKNGKDASQALKDFKKKDSPWDVATSVNMVYVGFDCKPVTVVINLSAKRWPGWLDQFGGRGERIWTPEKGGPDTAGQRCYYVGLRDPRTVEWVELKRHQSDIGLRERTGPGTGGGGGVGDDVIVVSSRVTGEAAYGLDDLGDLESEELEAVRALIRDTHVSPTDAAVILRRAGHEIPRTKTKQQQAAESSQDQRQRSGNSQQTALKSHLKSVHGLESWHDPARFRKEIRRHTAMLNDWQNVPRKGGAEYLTEVQWDERVKAVKQATEAGECPWA